MMQLAATPGLIVAAPKSGSGKTTVALGIMRAAKRRGLAVQPFKCGPDYIDAAFHGVAAGRESYNLDTWAMRRELIGELVHATRLGADIAIAEGVMGLFDGAGTTGQCGSGSTGDLAALTGWPVVLVLDVSGQTETAAAVARGCASYRGDVRIAGIILNNVASARHAGLIVPAIERAGLKVLGTLLRNEGLSLPERHLGLVQAGETADIEEKLDRIADAIEKDVDLDGLQGIAVPSKLAAEFGSASRGLSPPGQRIALAQDRAFSFVYPHIVAGWRAAGAEIVPFSPLADEAPDASADAVWLPGGYPELHAGELAGRGGFRRGLADLAHRGVPIHGECGGYMVLGAGLEDASGGRHAMAGLLGIETSFKRRKLHLGYRRVRLLADSALGRAREMLYGHEFHYASLVTASDEPLIASEDAGSAISPESGSRRGTVTGTFFHVIDRAA